MAPSDEIERDFPGFFKVYKDGRVQRYWDTGDHVPAGLDSETGVETKDVVISQQTGVKARIFLPKLSGEAKLPVILHFHGGGFCIGSPFSPPFKIYLSALATQTNSITISIDYRLAPEHKLPIAFDDCWDGLKWVALHAGGSGPEPWMNRYADLGRIVLGGESAGATLAHYVAVQAGARGLDGKDGVRLSRMVLVHPYFGSEQPDGLIQYMWPTTSGTKDDPMLHPARDPDVGKMRMGKVLVCVAEKDPLKGRGDSYVAAMREKKSGGAWGGSVEYFETKGEDHCFHFFNPKSENIGPLMKTIFDFVNQDG
ncbi:2-hydroxyisoflavanone dehydratase [Linum perenne]